MLRKSVFALVLLQSLAFAERFHVQISEDLTTENCTQTLIKLEVKLFANLKHGLVATVPLINIIKYIITYYLTKHISGWIISYILFYTLL